MARSKPGSLTANTAATTTVDDTWPHGITIIKLTGAEPIWYRLDGTNPTVGGQDCFVCVDAVFIPNPAAGEGYTPQKEGVEVRLISAAAATYTVEGNPVWKATP